MKPELKWLDDPEVFRVNRMDAHSDHYFYKNKEDAKNTESVLRQSLNGTWEFAFSENASSRPADFYKPEFDRSGFTSIQVPGHIELAGFDKIHYINTMYPWEGHFYRRPAYTTENSKNGAGVFSEAPYNPVGSYVKRFDLDKELAGKRVYICFEGVEQAMYLWLNGKFVGYAEDTFTPSEFDLTPYIQERGNILAVEVHKRSTAAFLEDQDFFRFFGIFRNVTLLAKPSIHLEDLWAKPVLKGESQGYFSMDLKISTEQNKPFKVKVRLSGKQTYETVSERMEKEENQKSDVGKRTEQNTVGKKDGNVSENEIGKRDGKRKKGERDILFQEEILLNESRSAKKAESGSFELKYQLEEVSVGEVAVWDNHSPNLYRLEIGLFDENGKIKEFIPCDIGFRRIEILDKVVYLNSKRLIINGVNRHEWNAKTGRSITMDDMKTDMKIFLKNHINAVRTCHYPDQIPWYYLCDKYGIYLMAETNLESHGSWQKMGGIEPSYNVPGSVPQWKAAVLDRAESNFELFKNHPSVLFWSLGNESYAGEGIAAMDAYFKGKKDGRLTHYEGVVNNRAYEDVISDLESRMYASPEEIVKYLENNPKKPFILCEYMHDMGNSLGGMGFYIELIDRYEQYCGGFIWDYIDQAILVKDEVTGREVMRYGGDFDDRPADYEFSGDGILFADRTEKPAMQEVRYYYGLHK